MATVFELMSKKKDGPNVIQNEDSVQQQLIFTDNEESQAIEDGQGDNYDQQFTHDKKDEFELEEEFKDETGQDNAVNQRGRRTHVEYYIDQQKQLRNQQEPLQNMQQQIQSLQRTPINSNMVSTQTLAPFMKTKKNAYNILVSEAQYYLPPYDECTLEFMRDLLSGKKKCFKNSQIKIIKVPKLEELTAKKIMIQIMGNESFQQFLPDLASLKRPLNREYLFNIINTLQPQFFEKNIPHAFKKRKEDAEQRRQQMIEVCSEMLEAIKNSNQKITSNDSFSKRFTIDSKGKALSMLTAGPIDKRRKRARADRPKYDTLVPLATGNPVDNYMHTMDFGSPRQFKKVKRHFQGVPNNSKPNDFIFINQQQVFGQSSASESQQLSFSGNTTKTHYTNVSGQQQVQPFNMDKLSGNAMAQQQQPLQTQGNSSGISASSQNQPQRRLL